MNPEKIYATLPVTEIAAAEAWYAKLLGRPADNRPMPTLVQWELSRGAGFSLIEDATRAGRGMVSIWVSDLAGERRRLEGDGIVLGEDIPGQYSTLAQVSDPDGNAITLMRPPAKPFPTA